MNTLYKLFSGAVAACGAWLAYLLGGWDAALSLMFLMMGLDYLTGLIAAFTGKSTKTEGGGFRSSVAFVGISKKLMMVCVVMLSVALDRLTGSSGICRSASIGFMPSTKACPSWKTPPRWACRFPRRSKTPWTSFSTINPWNNPPLPKPLSSFHLSNKTDRPSKQAIRSFFIFG